MSSQFNIQLHNLRFFGFHGVYEEERKLGNEFEVNISLTIAAPDEVLTTISDTINYAEAWRITREVFSKPTPLLETLAMQIARALKAAFPATRSLEIRITKLHPPITAFTGSVSVTYQKQYD